MAAAAVAVGVVGGMQIRERKQNDKRRGVKIISCSSSSSSLMDSYKTLRIQPPGASPSDVKKAFRHLALQYHPDVCRGSKCGVQFHQINQAAYDIVMSNLRGEFNIAAQVYEEAEAVQHYLYDDDDDDLWEEWMGWEGAGIRDYSSHINRPYI